MSDKFILTVKEMHLGYVKETFRAGAVIELDNVNKRLIIDGRKFEDTRDLDVLRRQAIKNPDSAWMIPYSEEALELIRSRPVKVAPVKPRPGENMQVVKSDEDLNEPIDIRDTQVSRKNNEAKEAARNRPKSDKLEIIKGDESVQDRIAALKDKTDINSMAERVRLKQAATKMTIVRDDSLGMGVSSRATAMNAGQRLPSREVVEANAEETKLMADARKKEIESRRKTSGIEVPSENAPEQKVTVIEDADEGQQSLVSEVAGSVEPLEGSNNGSAIELEEGEVDVAKDAEIVALKAKIAELEAQNKKPAAIRRSPVRTVAQAQAVLSDK